MYPFEIYAQKDHFVSKKWAVQVYKDKLIILLPFGWYQLTKNWGPALIEHDALKKINGFPNEPYYWLSPRGVIEDYFKDTTPDTLHKAKNLLSCLYSGFIFTYIGSSYFYNGEAYGGSYKEAYNKLVSDSNDLPQIKGPA